MDFAIKHFLDMSLTSMLSEYVALILAGNVLIILYDVLGF